MAETQATSGSAGGPTKRVDEQQEAPTSGGPTAVGRASVPTGGSSASNASAANAGTPSASAGQPAGGRASDGPSGAGSAPDDAHRREDGGNADRADAGGGEPSARRSPAEPDRAPAADGVTASHSGDGGGAARPSGDGDAGARPSGAGASGRADGGTAGDGRARYTRPPGMVPPPDRPPSDGDGSADREPDRELAEVPAVVSASASVPVRPGSAAVTPPVSNPSTAATTAATRRRPSLSAIGRSVASARVADAVRAARATATAAAARGPRRARLTLKRVDPWSVMKFSFAVSLVLFIVTIVATSVLYLALDAMGVFTSINQSLGDLLTSADAPEGETFKITAKGVIGTAALLGAVNVVLLTALATLAAFIYNVCADMVGGIEVTLSERE